MMQFNYFIVYFLESKHGNCLLRSTGGLRQIQGISEILAGRNFYIGDRRTRIDCKRPIDSCTTKESKK